MDWLTETPAYGTTLAPQLLGVKIIEICAGALLLLTLLTVTIGWAQHLSGCMWLLALVPLAVDIAAGITAHALHDTYIYWVYYLEGLPPRFPGTVEGYVEHAVTNANQTAMVLGWVFAVVTGVLFVLSLFDLWRLVVPGRPRNRSVPLALDS